MVKKKVLGLVALLGLLAVACAPQLPSYQATLESEGAIYLYLQPIPQEAHRLEFSISSIAAIRHDGGLVQLSQSLGEVKGRELLGLQKRLASGVLPPGLYKGVLIEIGNASLIGETGTAALVVPEEPLLIEQEFTVIRKRSSALFLSLGPEKLVTDEFRFTPVFSLKKPNWHLTNLLGFVTNSGSNVVSVFNKMTMEVVDIIATGLGPKGIALDQGKGWVYVAVAGDDAVEVIDVNTGELIGRLTLNFGDDPGEISLSASGRTLVTANTGSNTVSLIDADTLREEGRVSVPSEPTSVVVDTGRSRAYVLHSLSSAISVIDLSRRALTATRIIEESPIRGEISTDGEKLYAITRNSPNLLVIDLANLTVTARAFVGIGASSIKLDRKTGLIYVGKKTGEIAVIDPSLSLTFIDTFKAKGSAAYLTIDSDEDALFAVLPDQRVVQKIDRVSKKALGVLEVQEGSYAVVIMGER